MKKRKTKSMPWLLLFIIAVSMLIPFIVREKYQAATSYTNAKEFYESTALRGQHYHAEMINGTIYYATVGKLASSSSNLRYHTVGFDIQLSGNGHSVSFTVQRTGGSMEQIGPSVPSNGYEYNLYAVKDSKLFELATRANPTEAAYVLNSSAIEVKMDAIMTSRQGNSLNGGITENGFGGFTRWGTIYRLKNYSDLAALKQIFTGHEFRSYYNIKEKLQNYSLNVRYAANGTPESNYGCSSTATAGNGFQLVNYTQNGVTTPYVLYANGGLYTSSSRTINRISILNPDDAGLSKKGYHLIDGQEWTTADRRYFTHSTYMPKDIDANAGYANINLYLYANWQPNCYTVTYNANGGVGTITPTVLYYDHANYLRANSFYRTGYYLPAGAEWNTKPDGTGTSYGSNQLVKNLTAHNGGNIVLYANWKPLIVSITADKQGGYGGTDIFYQKYNTGFSLSMDFSNLIRGIDIPLKTGYHFLGYFRGYKSLGGLLVNTDGSLEVGSSYFVRNTTIYADWKAKQYTVTFDKQGGSGGTDQVTSTYDQKMPIADAPVRNGFSFKGYYSQPDKNGTLYYNEFMASDIIYQTDADMTLYAYWLDDILPDVQLNSDKKDWTNKIITLTANAYDYGVGLDNVKIYGIAPDGSLSLVAEQNDLNGIHSATLSFVNTIEGVTRYKAVATDLNGNISESYNVAYYDTKAPTGDSVEVSQDGTTFHFKIHVTDIHVQ